jgi:N-acetylneuraminic acid mutarotase
MWRTVSSANAPTPRRYHSAIWTGTEMIVWGGDDNPERFHSLGDGARYNPATDQWTPVSKDGAPLARYAHTATWTGREMIIWGGIGCATAPDGGAVICNDGGRYDPALDKWSSTGSMGAPSARVGHTSVWSGKQLLIWGGSGPECAASHVCADGASYDPITDSWQPMSRTGAPTSRESHVAIWVEDRMIVWGGVTGHERFELDDGAEFVP